MVVKSDGGDDLDLDDGLVSLSFIYARDAKGT